jgi:heme-degrading monooxygenase HmoA
MEGDVYNLAVWKVKPGQEESFIAGWKEGGAFVFTLPSPPIPPYVLIQSLGDPMLFYSFGAWRSLEDVQAMRAHPRTGELTGKLAALCEQATPGAFRVVARAPED